MGCLERWIIPVSRDLKWIIKPFNKARFQENVTALLQPTALDPSFCHAHFVFHGQIPCLCRVWRCFPVKALRLVCSLWASELKSGFQLTVLGAELLTLSLLSLPPSLPSPSGVQLQCMTASLWMLARRCWIFIEYKCIFVQYACMYVCACCLRPRERARWKEMTLGGLCFPPLTTFPTSPNAFPHWADKKKSVMADNAPKETLFPVPSSHRQQMHKNTHAHMSTQTHKDMPNMGISIRNYPYDTRRKRLPLRSNQCPLRRRWAGQSFVGPVKFIPLAQPNVMLGGVILWRATPDGSVKWCSRMLLW